MSTAANRKQAFLDYDAFVAKFNEANIPHTTDDCITPPRVYNAVLDYVVKRYDVDEHTPIVRPFFPGGDYKNYDYPDDCIVIDNPPFSTLAKIVSFYLDRVQQSVIGSYQTESAK